MPISDIMKYREEPDLQRGREEIKVFTYLAILNFNKRQGRKEINSSPSIYIFCLYPFLEGAGGKNWVLPVELPFISLSLSPRKKEVLLISVKRRRLKKIFCINKEQGKVARSSFPKERFRNVRKPNHTVRKNCLLPNLFSFS